MKTYHIAKNGQDNDSFGGDENHSWMTIGYAAKRASGGDTVILDDGVYDESMLNFTGGSANALTTLKALNRNKAIIRPTSLSSQGWVACFDQHTPYVAYLGIFADVSAVTGGPRTPYYAQAGTGFLVYESGTAKGSRGGGTADSEASGIDLGQATLGGNVIRDFDLFDNGAPGSNFDHQIYLVGSNNVVEDSRISVSIADGEAITLHDVNGQISGNIIRRNRIFDNKGHAIVLSERINGGEISDNFISGNAVGVYSYNGVIVGVKILRNTFNGNRGAAVTLTPGSVDTLVKDNVWSGNGYDGVEDGGTGTIQEGNTIRPGEITPPAIRTYRFAVTGEIAVEDITGGPKK